MDALILFMKILATAGSAFCFGAYIYAYVFKPRGNRRMHVASLLFSGVAVVSLIGLLDEIMMQGTAVGGVTLTVFLLLSVVSQATTAFRGRAGDRREAQAPDMASAQNRRAADRKVEASPEAA